MSWIGGKKALRELIVRLFPLYYERYIEVFGGGGWVLFHKPPGNDFEVYNDFNGLLVNLYRCVRDEPEELMEALRYVLNAREDFDRVRSALARDSPASDVQRAAWFYQLIRYSYASGLTSFGSQPHDRYTPPCFKKSASISLGGGHPARSARRRKWLHCTGLKQYFGSTPPSKICHEKDALPSCQPGACPILGVHEPPCDVGASPSHHSGVCPSSRRRH